MGALRQGIKRGARLAIGAGRCQKPAALRGRTAQRQRRARGRVDLVLVVGLEDLDVVVGAKTAGRFLDKGEGEIDAEREVRIGR